MISVKVVWKNKKHLIRSSGGKRSNPNFTREVTALHLGLFLINSSILPTRAHDSLSFPMVITMEIETAWILC